ncbi:hypothetical protein ACRALDRAFT_1063121 [Sodiomyces alcalophilus JCM 7366]|uniref:uncharacterized protein n=1 Tax=Sodiomyces alcalophilus JCM 7366 TaxID=591952 RepID=UPI0039B638C3
MDDELIPWDTQDNEYMAEAYYNEPLRTQNRILADENLKLKRLLRENYIAWSPLSNAYLRAKAEATPPPGCQTTCSGSSGAFTTTTTTRAGALPLLPTEVLLRILQYALTASEPIIDPLCKAKPENLTSREKSRGNQIAIHILATCKVMHVEGSRILWTKNTFTFTTPENLRRFCELDFSLRKDIKRVNLRIVAQFYDDVKRNHYIPQSYHPSLKKNIILRVHPRISERNYARGGFRCYSWLQIVDFLQALRAPFDPKHDKKLVAPRLLPGLESLRIDLVNFIDDLLPMFASELHNIASHEFGCTLNELAITGLPVDDPGVKASAELCGLLKDEGLFMTGLPAYIQGKKGLIPLSGPPWCARVVRAWKTLSRWLPEHTSDDDASHGASHDAAPHNDASGDDASDDDPSDDDSSDQWDDMDLSADDEQGMDPHDTLPSLMSPAPEEPDAPKTSPQRKGKTIWKRVPVSRDSDTRRFVEFCRNSGYPVDITYRDTNESIFDDAPVCPCCGEMHPGFLDLFGF